MSWLLDTHVIAWLVEGRSDLSAHARSTLEQQAVADGLLVAAITFWELGLLFQRQRISLSCPLPEWRRHVLGLRGVAELELTGDIAIEATQLPGAFHADPADRLLVASARIHGLTLVTHDARMLTYGKEGHVAVLGV